MVLVEHFARTNFAEKWAEQSTVALNRHKKPNYRVYVCCRYDRIATNWSFFSLQMN